MKYKVNEAVNSLNYFKKLINVSGKIELLNDLEIDPFQQFSIEFSSSYWYFKYSLLRNGKVEIVKSEIDDEYQTFFNEAKLNIISLDILDENNYNIKAIDGEFYIDIFNHELMPIVAQYKKKWVQIDGNIPD